MQYLPVVRRNSASMQNAVSSDVVTPAKFTGKFSYVHKKLGGKAVWLAVILGFLLSLSFTLKATAQSCGPATDGSCTWGAWILPVPNRNVCVPVTVNGETCTICFFYNYRRCGTTNFWQSKCIGFTVPLPPCGIGAYLDNLRTIDHNAWSNEVHNIIKMGDDPCAEDVFLGIIRNGNSSYDCLSSSGCSTSGFGAVTVQTYFATCYELIQIFTASNPATGDPGCPGFFARADCASDICCIKSKQMCYDNSTGQVRICNTVV